MVFILDVFSLVKAERTVQIKHKSDLCVSCRSLFLSPLVGTITAVLTSLLVFFYKSITPMDSKFNIVTALVCSWRCPPNTFADVSFMVGIFIAVPQVAAVTNYIFVFNFLNFFILAARPSGGAVSSSHYSRRQSSTRKVTWTGDTKVRFRLHPKCFQTVFSSFTREKTSSQFNYTAPNHHRSDLWALFI